ncbi:hypothetical protein NKG05_20890 [Oerskovia sp. M15]
MTGQTSWSLESVMAQAARCAPALSTSADQVPRRRQGSSRLPERALGLVSTERFGDLRFTVGATVGRTSGT